MTKPESLPEHLRPIWDEMEGEVHVRIGAAGMEALCTQVHRLRQAREAIEKDGLVVQDPKGNAVAHPALDIEKKANAEIRQWVKGFRKQL